jgi:hypothetical protein
MPIRCVTRVLDPFAELVRAFEESIPDTGLWPLRQFYLPYIDDSWDGVKIHPKPGSDSVIIHHRPERETEKIPFDLAPTQTRMQAWSMDDVVEDYPSTGVQQIPQQLSWWKVLAIAGGILGGGAVVVAGAVIGLASRNDGSEPKAAVTAPAPSPSTATVTATAPPPAPVLLCDREGDWGNLREQAAGSYDLCVQTGWITLVGNDVFDTVGDCSHKGTVIPNDHGGYSVCTNKGRWLPVNRPPCADFPVMNICKTTAVAAPPLPSFSGRYSETNTSSEGQRTTREWIVTPCGDGCADIAENGDHVQATLVDGRWEADTPAAAVCSDGSSVPRAGNVHFSLDAVTLRGTAAVNWTKPHCGNSAGWTETENIVLTKEGN